MSTSADDDLTTLLSDLVTTLRQLETEIEPTTESGLPRPPTPGELLRFTNDVTIPAVILVLKTNIEVLKLLRRALRMAEGRPPTGTGPTEVRRRATELSRVSLSRLDDALSDLQRAVEGVPEDEEARELLREARQLRKELADRLSEEPSGSDAVESTETTDVPVDVDAELRSIKDEIDGRDGSNTGNENGEDDDGS